MKCVEIMLSDEGTFTVIECAPSEEMGKESAEGSGKTFDNAEDASNAAMELLREPASPDQANAAMSAGYDKVAGNKPKAGMSSMSSVFGE